MIEEELIKENFKLKDELRMQRNEYQETYKDVRQEIRDYKKALNKIREYFNQSKFEYDNLPVNFEDVPRDILQIIDEVLGDEK